MGHENAMLGLNLVPRYEIHAETVCFKQCKIPIIKVHREGWTGISRAAP